MFVPNTDESAQNTLNLTGPYRCPQISFFNARSSVRIAVIAAARRCLSMHACSSTRVRDAAFF
jgi:hypothetical protein